MSVSCLFIFTVLSPWKKAGVPELSLNDMSGNILLYLFLIVNKYQEKKKSKPDLAHVSEPWSSTVAH